MDPFSFSISHDIVLSILVHMSRYLQEIGHSLFALMAVLGALQIQEERQDNRYQNKLVKLEKAGTTRGGFKDHQN